MDNKLRKSGLRKDTSVLPAMTSIHISKAPERNLQLRQRLACTPKRRGIRVLGTLKYVRAASRLWHPLFITLPTVYGSWWDDFTSRRDRS